MNSYEKNTITIGYGLPEIKSCLQAGNLTIMNTKHFNWFQKKMWKIFFGFDIKDVKENYNDNTKN